MEKSVLELSSRHPMPSLEKLALIKVTTSLSNYPRLLSLIIKSRFTPTLDKTFSLVVEEEWTAIQTMANQLVSQLSISVILKKRILELLWSLSYQIMNWLFKYADKIAYKFLRHFYWTDRGRIDHIRTVRYIVQNERIPIRKRFILACSACLSNEIHEMWLKMPDWDQIYFLDTNKETFRPLLSLWSHTMRGADNMLKEFCPVSLFDAVENGLPDDVLREFLPGAMFFAVQNGLVEAVKYLFGLLSADSKVCMATLSMKDFIQNIENTCFLREYDIDLGYFLFFELTDDFQDLFFNGFSLLPLSLLLHSSEHKLFLNLLAERIESLTTQHIRLLLLMIFHNYHFEVKDNDYSMLFIDVWRMLPSSMRGFKEDTDLGVHFLVVLIRDNFPFLLEDRAFEKIPKLISSSKKNRTPATPFGFHRGKWKFLQVLISEEIAKIESLKKYKGALLSVLRMTMKADRAAWNRILRFVVKIRNTVPEEK